MNKDEEFRKKFMEDLKKGEVDKEGNIYFNSVSGKDKIGKIKTQNLQEYEKEEKNKKSLELFKQKDILIKIKQELDKDHLEDDNLKMTAFLTAVSGLLPNPKRRMSIAITGDSSTGKDNLITTILKHIPESPQIFLTSGTQATIEDDVQQKRIIAFSEINANREIGANKHLIEVIKQKTEGGTSSIKKDARDGFKSARFEKGEQGSVLFGTTEARMDEEMSTRFIKGTIKTNFNKIKEVNNYTLTKFSNEENLLNESKEEDSFIRVGLGQLYNDDFEVLIPYAKYLNEKVNNKEIFDHSDPRSQRAIKRLLSLTCATTLIHKQQREVRYYEGKKLLISEPQDFLNTLYFSQEFFNQSYTGLDSRLNAVLEYIDKQTEEWVSRDDIQENLGVTRNTIKNYCSELSDYGLIEGTSGKELNETEGFKVYNGNKIYYKRCQKGVKKALIGCQISELKNHLEQKTGKNIDTFLIPLKSGNFEGFEPQIDKKGVKTPQKKVSIKGYQNDPERCQNAQNSPNKSKIDTFGLTPFENKGSEAQKTLENQEKEPKVEQKGKIKALEKLDFFDYNGNRVYLEEGKEYLSSDFDEQTFNILTKSDKIQLLK